MYRRLFLALILLSLALSPIRVYSLKGYSLKSVCTIIPDIAVILEGGTAGTSEIGINGTTSNATVSCVYILTPIVNPNFTDGSGTDAYDWTENSSTNIAVEWDSTDKNMRFYIEAAKVVEEATCYQDFNYSGTTTSANLTFNYTVDFWGTPLPDNASLKVQLKLPNMTVFDVWTHSPTGTEALTWVSVNITDYMNQMGTYRLLLYFYVDTPSATKLYSFRWDDVGINIETKGLEHDYVLKAVSQKSYNQTIRLSLYNYNNTGRLKNCTIWFRDTTTSIQIKITDGTIVTSTGDWYDSPASSERYLVVYAEESLSGTSILSIRLEATEGNSIIYTCLIKLTIN